MKKNVFSAMGKAAALVVSLSLILSVASPLFAFAATEKLPDLDKNRDGTVDYVVIGSYDAAGFGISGYNSEKPGYGTVPDGSYADTLRDKIEASGKNVNITAVGIGGMRAEEVRYLFDSDYAGDDYTESAFLGDNGIFAKCGGASALRESCLAAVRSAEVITLDIGFDNFASYALSYIFENKYEADFSVFGQEMQTNIDRIKDNLTGALGDFASVGEDSFAKRTVDGLAYALVGFCFNFDAVLGEIYDVNPEAEVVVSSVRNPIDGIDIQAEVAGFSLPLGTVYGAAVDMANIYIAALTEYKDVFTFSYYTPGASERANISGGKNYKYSPDKTAYLSAGGHLAMAEEILSAIKEKRTGFDIISNEMNEIYRYALPYLNRDTLVDFEYSFKTYYTCDENSYYVSLGDGSATGSGSYPERIASKLEYYGLSKTSSYKNYANKNLSPSAVEGLGLDETPYVTLEKIKESKTVKGNLYQDLIKADLITLSYTNIETTRYMLLGDPVTAKEWNDLGYAFGLETDLYDTVEQLVKTVSENLDEQIAGNVLPLIQNYAFAYLKRAFGYIRLVEYIHEINPEAKVVVVGTYNEMDGFKLKLNNELVSVGDLIGYLAELANLGTLGYAMLSDNTAYVASPKVETVYADKGGQTEFETLFSFITAFGRSIKSSDFLPSAKGYKDVADAVLNPQVFEIIEAHDCQYDNGCDARCNICKDKRAVSHRYSSACDASCDSCGALRRASEHIYYADCDADCNVCGETRNATDHTFSSDCDTNCNLCGIAREATAPHSFGDPERTNDGMIVKCTACGYSKPAEGMSAGAVVAISAGSAAVLGIGGFSLFWFVIKKKSFADFIALFVKK